MGSMFVGATMFNGNIGGWNTANVANMGAMFSGAFRFNQPIGGWDTASVTYMGNMFYGATGFSQNIGGWNTANVTDMGSMFRGAASFNQPIGGWDTASVTDMGDMFRGAASFNQDIGGWNTANVTDMANMFYGASGFNQDIGGWDVGKVTAMDTMFDDSGLSTANYDRVLLGWSGLPSLQANVPLGAAGIQFSCAAKAARQSLIDGHGWVITDAGWGPCVSVSPDPVGFGAITVGQTSSTAVTVSNYGGAGLVLPAGAVSLIGADAGQFAITGDICSGATVPPFGSCTVTVRFSPSSAGGKTAGLRVVSNGAYSPDTVALSGTGIAVPQPPTGVAAVAGDGQVTVSWSAPTDDGGSPVLDYTATANPGGATCTTTSTSCVVSGLTNGTGYTFTVTARNAIGMSVPSAPSATVTPAAPPVPAGHSERGQGRGQEGHGEDHLETGDRRHLLPGADLETGWQEVQGLEDHQQAGVQSQSPQRQEVPLPGRRHRGRRARADDQIRFKGK